MWNFLLVGFGGALGAMARYGVGKLVGIHPGGWPLATFICNVSGGFLMGLLAAALLRLGGGHGSEGWRLLLGVGVLGGYTTFSSFSLETLLLIDNGQVPVAVAYAFFSVLAALVAIALGLSLGRLFA